jgi:2-dehydro-3-deoxygalactonokinase
MPTPRFLAVDWGTTNLRAWVVDEDGRVCAAQDFPLGVSKLAPGEAARQFHDAVRPALGAEALPAILCGMVGSNLGWEQVPYFDCPADLATLAGGLRRVAVDGPPVLIVPGLRCQRPDGGPDVMRGEETQILGWAAAAPERSRGDRLVCHPGTHAKWVRLVDGRIDHFVTAMTGELFEVLRKHSVLQVRDSEDDPAAFDAGLKAAGDGGALASRLFTARARVVGGDMPPAAVKSYLSGVLIGAEVAATPALLGAAPGEPVALIGDEGLCRRYRRALEASGWPVSFHDGDEAALSGLRALFETERAR